MHTFLHISYSFIVLYPTPSHLVILLKAGASVHTHVFLLNHSLKVPMFLNVLANFIHHVLDQHNFFHFFPIIVRDGERTPTNKCVLICSMSKVAGLFLLLNTSSSKLPHSELSIPRFPTPFLSFSVWRFFLLLHILWSQSEPGERDGLCH